MSPTIDCRSFLARRFRLSIAIFIIDCRCENFPHQQINELCIKWCISPKKISPSISSWWILNTNLKFLRLSVTRVCRIEADSRTRCGIWHNQVILLCWPIYNFISQAYSSFSYESSVLLFKLQYVIMCCDEWNCVLPSCSRRCIYGDNLLLV